MGRHDSSKTRAEPIFKALLSADPTGVSWLHRLLELPTRSDRNAIESASGSTLIRYGWGSAEVRLDPPISLLSYLIRHPRKPQSGDLSKNPDKAAKRQQWIDGANDRIKEGLELLRHPKVKEDWHIFEGSTQPDVYLETEEVIVVIEGKRTERGPTTKTKWMNSRHQMLRHIDCAWELKGHKKVIGFFIVESLDGTADVPAEWCRHEAIASLDTSVSSSLPHRGPEEQLGIAKCFTGVTTWRKVCEEFKDLGLSYGGLPETTDDLDDLGVELKGLQP